MSDAIKAGFHANDTDTYYVTPRGRVWHVQSEDDPGTDEPVLCVALPADATPCDDLLTPGECIEYLRRIESVGDETLIES